jgi:hypothetical protein
MKRASDFLERGGAPALQVLLSGGQVLRALPECFDDWIDLLWAIAPQGKRAWSRSFDQVRRSFKQSPPLTQNRPPSRWRIVCCRLPREIGRVDAESALACMRISAKALRTVSIEQFENWARAGLIVGDSRARRSYYSLETRSSNEALHASDQNGVTLESVQQLLRLYIEALTGRAVEIASLAVVPVESRIGDGRTIHLPNVVAEFGDEELDFRLYKVLAAHAAGQIEFGTYEQNADDLRAAYASLSEVYDPAKQDERAAFADDGYLSQPPAVAGGPSARPNIVPPNLRYSDVLALFPIPALARRIFGTLENGRIDRRLRRKYRGLNRDLDLIRAHLRSRRPKILELPATLVPFELLFQITMLGGAVETRANSTDRSFPNLKLWWPNIERRGGDRRGQSDGDQVASINFFSRLRLKMRNSKLKFPTNRIRKTQASWRKRCSRRTNATVSRSAATRANCSMHGTQKLNANLMNSTAAKPGAKAKRRNRAWKKARLHLITTSGTAN